MKREKIHVRLAKFIAKHDDVLTEHDLGELLPFYKGSASHKKELLHMAKSYASTNGMFIRTKYVDGTAFYSGQIIPKTDVNKLIASVNNKLLSNTTPQGEGYLPYTFKLNEIAKVAQCEKTGFTNHHFKGNHRSKATMLPGFNCIALDVDGTVSIKEAKALLEGYAYVIYTTKSHGVVSEKNPNGSDRFRIVMPISHTLKLTDEEFSEFMVNVFRWLPFEVDTAAKDGSRNWACASKSAECIGINLKTVPGEKEGDPDVEICELAEDVKLLPTYEFIPDTPRAQKVKELLDESSMGRIERWFVMNTSTGNRNNNLYRYGMFLLDQGVSTQEFHMKLSSFNDKIENKLPHKEFMELYNGIIDRQRKGGN